MAGCPEAGHMSQVTDVQELSLWIFWFIEGLLNILADFGC